MKCVMESRLAVLQNRNFEKRYLLNPEFILEIESYGHKKGERKKTPLTITLYCCFQGRKQRKNIFGKRNLSHFLFVVG